MKQAAAQSKKKANLKMLFYLNNHCFPLKLAEITPTLPMISLKLSYARLTKNPPPYVLK